MANEDFTTYTEVDPGVDVTVIASKVSWIDLNPNWNTSYIYKDKGVNHFDGDFTHKFEVYSDDQGNVYVGYHMLSNTICDMKALETGSHDAIVFNLYAAWIGSYDPRWQLRVYDDGVPVTDEWTGAASSTLYYIELVRDDDGGANNTGRLTAYIRTGSHAGALQDTLVVDCAVGEQNDYRYVYTLASYDDNANASEIDGYTQNLNLGEAIDLSANNASSPTQITAPLLTVIRQFSASNIESLSQVTNPTVERGWLYLSDIPCNTEVTAPSFTIKHSLSIPNIECLSQVTVPSMLVNHLGANDVQCNAEITVPSFSAKREILVPNIESSSEVDVPDLVKMMPLNASDVSSLTEVTTASIYKELFPSNVESSSEVEAADLEYIKIGRMNVTLPMITAEISGGHGGFLNVELPMITAEMRAGARLNVILPMITAEITGSVGIKANLNVTLPTITAEMSGTVEVLGQLNVTLPMIQARMSGTAGYVGQLNVTLPMIIAQLSGYTDIDGQLNVTLPMIEARLIGTVERESCEILRYEEPELE